MTMDGRAFLDVALELAQGSTEAHWRAAAGRTYYALMLEGRTALERWGFPIPPRDQIHAFVRLRFTYATDSDLREVGYALERLVTLRNHADYQLSATGPFTDAQRVKKAINTAQVNLSRLDQVGADATRLAAAIAGIKAKGP